MKILHTADWHLGRKLNENIDLIEVQSDLLDKIYEILKEEKVDVFVLAGDIYQTVNPSDDAIRLLNDFLEKSVKDFKETMFIIISGNHDPKEKLNFGSGLLIENLKIISKFNKNLFPISITKNGTTYDFYPFPFYRIYEYKEQFSLNGSLNETKDIYEHLINHIELNKKNKNIFITHTAIDFMQKQVRTDSEDDSYGNIGLVPAELFSRFDLVLMGHYHKQQKFNGNIYYSGSIYKYSAKEYDHNKGVLIHNLANNKVDFLSLSPKRDVHYIKGTFNELINTFPQKYTKNQLNNDYYFIEIDEKNLIPYVKDQLSKYYKNIAGINYSENTAILSNSSINIKAQEIHQLNEIQLFEKFLEYLYLDEENKNNLEEVIQENTRYTKEKLINTFKDLWDEFQKTPKNN